MIEKSCKAKRRKEGRKKGKEGREERNARDSGRRKLLHNMVREVERARHVLEREK